VKSTFTNPAAFPQIESEQRPVPLQFEHFRGRFVADAVDVNNGLGEPPFRRVGPAWGAGLSCHGDEVVNGVMILMENLDST
jgi:hypothetical protein